MAYTPHGHHIQGTKQEQNLPASRARCGGPSLCEECKDYATNYLLTFNSVFVIEQHRRIPEAFEQRKCYFIIRDNRPRVDTLCTRPLTKIPGGNISLSSEPCEWCSNRWRMANRQRFDDSFPISLDRLDDARILDDDMRCTVFFDLCMTDDFIEVVVENDGNLFIIHERLAVLRSG